MVGRNIVVFVCVLVVLLCVSNVDASFKCYTCEGRSDMDSCSDQFTKSSNLESTATCLGCSKSKLNGVVTRACSTIFLGDTCEEKGGKTVCYCERNLCNGSNTLAVSMATLVGAIIDVVCSKF